MNSRGRGQPRNISRAATNSKDDPSLKICLCPNGLVCFPMKALTTLADRCAEFDRMILSRADLRVENREA